MPKDPLRGPKLKVERAKRHIHDLHSVVVAFIQSKPYRMFEEDNADGVSKNIKVQLRGRIPGDIGLIAADAVHNLRVSLDQMACRLAETNGASSTAGVYFPFGKNAQIFEAQIKQKIKKLHPDAVDMIRGLKAYPRGNDLLWSLNELDITDKHREIIAIGSMSSGISTSLLGPPVHSGDRISVYIRGPLRLTANPDWNPLDESAVVMTFPRDTKIEGQINLSLNIAFREVEPVKGQPIVGVLNQLADLVEGILLTFEARFFK